MAVEKDAAVGWRVRVFWEGDDEWFDGVVREYAPDSGYFVEYDDGERQWEAEDPRLLEFVGTAQSDADDAQLILATQANEEEGEEEEEEDRGGGGEAGREKWSAQPPPSTNGYEDDEDTYEDDHEEEEEEEGDEGGGGAEVSNPMPEEAGEDGDDGYEEIRVEPPAAKVTAGTSGPARAARDPTKYVKSGVFFRDPETLKDTKTTLLHSKGELKKQYELLASQLQQEEQVSASLKRELHGLKAQVTLASLTGTRGATSTSVPKTAKDWVERAVEQKLVNRSARHALAGLHTQLTQKTATIQQMETQKQQLTARLARVPRKDLSSLVDVQMEIAQRMSEKRELETQLAKMLTHRGRGGADKKAPATRASSSAATSSETQRDAKTELEKELRKLEKLVMATSDEVDEWRLCFEKENAKIQPLQARIDSLQQELRKYESSQVLLRSVFLRLDRAGVGEIVVDAVVDGFVLLAPPTAAKTREQVRAEVENALAAASKTGDKLNLAAFTDCFHRVFAT